MTAADDHIPVAGRSVLAYELRFLQEIPHNIPWIAMLAVYGVVHSLHLRVRDLTVKICKDPSHLRVLLYGLLLDHRHCLIRRKVMAVILQGKQIEGGNEAVGRI